MDFNDDTHLDVCFDIEVRLRLEYQRHPDLTDKLCAFGLENAVIAVKQHYGFAKNERVAGHPLIAGIVAACVELGDTRIGKIKELTLKEYVIRIAKIKRSVLRHSDHGLRAYYEFIQQYV
ncbi:MAG TPA: hypothetical protein DCW29_00010 [Janthinobacterium sp.]|nr:hypothetical protein [Janthinobacterium sp.]